MLVKRHGTKIHAHTAITFTYISVITLVLYSVLVAASRRYKPLRKLVYFFSAPLTLLLIWILLLLYAILHHFSSDFLQTARRYGQISIACATLSVLLSFKPAIMPYTHQVGLVSVHKWIGRTSVFLAIVHGVIYFFSYAKALKHTSSSTTTTTPTPSINGTSHLVARHNGEHHHLFSLYNIFGMIAFISFCVIFVSSLGPVRRRAYHLFYALHRPLAILVYVMMIWHARPSASLLVFCALVLIIAQVVYHLLMSSRITVETVKPFSDNLCLVEFSPSIPESAMKNIGSHVRVGNALNSPLTFFKSSHPYTLVSRNQLVARTGRFKLVEGQAYSLSGPFDASLQLDYDNYIVIAGGSGVSMLPRFAKEIKKENLMMVWITKRAQEVEILPEIGIDGCEVYITGDNDAENMYELQEFEIEDEMEDENDALLSGGGQNKKVTKHKGRPDLEKLTGSFLDQKQNTCIVVCGPESLVMSVQAFAKRRRVECWGEVYAL